MIMLKKAVEIDRFKLEIPVSVEIETSMKLATSGSPEKETLHLGLFQLNTTETETFVYERNLKTLIGNAMSSKSNKIKLY